MNSRIILAALAVTTISISAPAQARANRTAQSEVSCFSGTRYVACSVGAERPRYRAPDRRGRLEVAKAPHRRAERRIAAQDATEAIPGSSGVIRSGKTGATARVSPRYQDRFQSFLDDIEAHGAAVYYMGGIRPGSCSLASQHPCGWAVDFCQDYRGHVSGLRDCHLPRPAEFHDLVRAHGLYDGSVWCHGDYGHVQAKDSGDCNTAAHGNWGHGRVRLATMTGKIEYAASTPHHHRRHIRYARR